MTFVEYEIMDDMTECKPSNISIILILVILYTCFFSQLVSYDEATYEIRKIANCLAKTAEADNNSFESWEIPPRLLGHFLFYWNVGFLLFGD